MYQLTISLKRVQTFIFEVPRLKAMLGANALVGDTLRHELAARLGNDGKRLEWPDSVPLQGVEDDPLNKAADSADHDDPKALYQRGILARDGGHFIAVFQDETAADAFRREAETLLAERLPGVLFDAEIESFPKPEKTKTEDDEAPRAGRTPREIHLLDLPVLQVCQETERGPASDEFDKDNGTKGWRARSVKHREDWGDKFYRAETVAQPEIRDLISLLRRQLYPERVGRDPKDIADLAAGGYVALIHADGNRIGQRYNDWREKCKETDAVAKEAHGEVFYYSMRVAVRKALIAALGQTFDRRYATRPYEILMLGGDDLLLLCRADQALNLAEAYAAELKNHKLADGQPLDVAIGVAIAQKTYPLHRLHELAESLAGSAKRLYRSLPGEDRGSVIDWQVVTQSWFEGVKAARRRGEVIRYTVDGKCETLLLTGRPYLTGTLKTLLDAAKALDDKAGTRPNGDPDGAEEPEAARAPNGASDAARSPLRALRTACEQGRLAGERAFGRLPEAVRKKLGCPKAAASPGTSGDHQDSTKPSLWINRSSADPVYLTRALDIIGIREISQLGKKKND